MKINMLIPLAMVYRCTYPTLTICLKLHQHYPRHRRTATEDSQQLTASCSTNGRYQESAQALQNQPRTAAVQAGACGSCSEGPEGPHAARPPLQMLHDARVAGLVKLRCSVRPGYESQLRAGHVDLGVAGETGGRQAHADAAEHSDMRTERPSHG